MILTCPQCATRYQTDAALFAPPGRKVKCAKCAHVWLQAAPPPEPELDIAAEEPPPSRPVDEPVPQRAAYAPPQEVYAPARDYAPASSVAAPAKVRGASWSTRLGLAAGWIGLAAIVLVIGWAAETYRQQIASLWPQSSSLYSALGLKVNARGIDIVDPADHVEKEDGQFVLVVTGKLVNITGRELTVPPLSVVLTDDDMRSLYQWSFSPGASTLKPGESVPFRTRLSSPPSGVKHLQIRFGGSG
jgi:predicted Zn finger-like uncharacterized protein